RLELAHDPSRLELARLASIRRGGRERVLWPPDLERDREGVLVLVAPDGAIRLAALEDHALKQGPDRFQVPLAGVRDRADDLVALGDQHLHARARRGRDLLVAAHTPDLRLVVRELGASVRGLADGALARVDGDRAGRATVPDRRRAAPDLPV